MRKSGCWEELKARLEASNDHGYHVKPIGDSKKMDREVIRMCDVRQ